MTLCVPEPIHVGVKTGIKLAFGVTITDGKRDAPGDRWHSRGDTSRSAAPYGAVSLFAESVATEIIFAALDIILTEIAAMLHFNEDQVHVADAGYPVPGMQRNIHRLTWSQGYLLFVQRNQGLSAHHMPMLAASLVPLEAETAVGLNNDALHLVIGLIGQDVVLAPWAYVMFHHAPM